MSQLSSGFSFLLVTMLCICITAEGVTQVFLQVERQNRLKTFKFEYGDSFEIRLYEDPSTWWEVTILDIKPERGEILFDIGTIKPEEIQAMRTFKQKNRGRGVFNATLQFGAGALLFSLADLAYGNSYNWGFMAGAGILVGAGALFKLISDQFYYRFDRRHRLRIIDLRFSVD